VRIFKNKPFERFARKASLADEILRKVVADAERGLVDTDLGGGSKPLVIISWRNLLAALLALALSSG
jgi:hypothetical protein